MPRVDGREREREREADRRAAKESYGHGPPAKKPAMNEYFVDGEGIDREVLQSELCKFLGTDATCKPAEYNGIKGYKIRALRPFTSEMLVDLKELSKSYMLENRRHPGDLSWEDSDVFRQWAHAGPPPPQGPGASGYPPTMSHPYTSQMHPDYPQGGYQGAHPNQGQGGYPPYSSTMAPSMGGMSAPSMDNYGDSGRYAAMGQPPRDYPPSGYYPPPGDYNNVPRAQRDQPMPQGFGGYNNPGPSQDPRGGGYPGGYGQEPPMGRMTGPGAPYDMPRPPNGSPYGGPIPGDGPPGSYARQGPNPFAQRGRGHP